MRNGRLTTGASIGLLSVVVIALLAGCAPRDEAAEPAPDTAADTEAVLAAHRALIEAYEEGSIDAFTWLLAPSVDLVIFHPFRQSRFDGIEDVKAGALAMFGRLGRVTWTEAHPALTLRGDVAWVTSHVLIESPSLGQPFLGRGTEIWTREGDRWLLIHGHWSPTPGVWEPTESM